MPPPPNSDEEEYFRLRRGDAQNGKPSSSSNDEVAAAKKAAEEPLDDTITEEDAEQLKEQGNKLFRTAQWAEAADLYTRAARSAHAPPAMRAVYIANRAACRFKLNKFKEVVADTSTALELRPDYKKARARRKEARLRLSDFRGALEDARALDENPAEIMRLTQCAEEKEKKDREEAMDSLKGLGNSILSNFGMSLDDFSMQKDPTSGSYSIQMKK